MSVYDQLEADLAEVRRILGPPPTPPVLRDVVQAGDETPAAFDGSGTHWIAQLPAAYLADPNNALLVQNYQQELASYNASVAAMLGRLDQLRCP